VADDGYIGTGASSNKSLSGSVSEQFQSNFAGDGAAELHIRQQDAPCAMASDKSRSRIRDRADVIAAVIRDPAIPNHDRSSAMNVRAATIPNLLGETGQQPVGLMEADSACLV
jgi:hypothetical protein